MSAPTSHFESLLVPNDEANLPPDRRPNLARINW